MRIIKNVSLTIMVLLITASIEAQTTNPAAQVADKIAKKMKDTLILNGQQRQQIYNVNMSLHNQKQTARQTYTNHTQLTTAMQAIEKKRDSLYLPILGQAKYQLYLQKKRNLINNN